MPSSSKFNVNVSKEWSDKVLPILEKWKLENDGNFSDKVCEAIEFMETAKMEKIYEAIMQYDGSKATTKRNSPLSQEQQEFVEGLLERGGDPLFYLTKNPTEGPLLTTSKALRLIKEINEMLEADGRPFGHTRGKRGFARLTSFERKKVIDLLESGQQIKLKHWLESEKHWLDTQERDQIVKELADYLAERTIKTKTTT